MNALTQCITEAKIAAAYAAEADDTGVSDWQIIRLRVGDTLMYRGIVGPRGGISIQRRRTGGWILDHPADFAEPSY